MGKHIAIDAGHGGKDPGACGNGYRECDITLEVSLALKKRLVSHGFKVSMTRESDVYVGDASERGKKLGQFKPDFALSIHCNSATSKTATGAEIIVPIQETYGVIERYMVEEFKKLGNFRKVFSRCYDTGKTYARVIDSKTGKFDKSYPNKRDYYGICRGAWTYGVSADIVELFFISNATDCANYKKQKKAYVEALVKSICLGFKVDYQAPVVETPNTTKQTYYRVMAGSYSVRNNAEKVKNELVALGYSAFLTTMTKDGKTFYRVVVGSFSNRANADACRTKVLSQGYSSAFIEVFEK